MTIVILPNRQNTSENCNGRDDTWTVRYNQTFDFFFQLFETYLQFVGIAITNAQIVEDSRAEYDRNRVSGLVPFLVFFSFFLFLFLSLFSFDCVRLLTTMWRYFAELVGGRARSVRRTNVHRQSDHEDNAAGPEAVEMWTGGRVAGGRVLWQHQVLQAVRLELAQAQHQEQRKKVSARRPDRDFFRFFFSLSLFFFRLGLMHSIRACVSVTDSSRQKVEGENVSRYLESLAERVACSGEVLNINEHDSSDGIVDSGINSLLAMPIRNKNDQIIGKNHQTMSS